MDYEEKLDKAYAKFSETHNVIENTFTGLFLKTWELFNRETKVALLADEIKNRLVDDPEYEVWVKLHYPTDNPRYLSRLLVSSKGRMYSLFSNKLLKLHYRPNHYVTMNIANGICLMMHRVMALNFIPKKEELKNYTYGALHVNHKDLDKHNNAIDNLEWCLPSENTIHAFENGAMTRGKMDPRTKPILVEVMDGKYKGEQFVLFGKKQLKGHGFNQGNVTHAIKTGIIIVGCRFKYITLGESESYPHEPPEGFDVKKLMIPQHQRTTRSWKEEAHVE